MLHKTAPAAVLEKASIDEVYMDVTALVDNELQAGSHRSRAAFFVTRSRCALARRPGQSAAPYLARAQLSDMRAHDLRGAGPPSRR